MVTRASVSRNTLVDDSKVTRKAVAAMRPASKSGTTRRADATPRKARSNSTVDRPTTDDLVAAKRAPTAAAPAKPAVAPEPAGTSATPRPQTAHEDAVAAEVAAFAGEIGQALVGLGALLGAVFGDEPRQVGRRAGQQTAPPLGDTVASQLDALFRGIDAGLSVLSGQDPARRR